MKKEAVRAVTADFLTAMLAGLAISIGGAVFLSLDNKLAGALMFTVGLYTVCVQKLNLFTGKVGYLPEKNLAYAGFLGNVWLGNLCGTVLAAYLLLATRTAGIAEKAKAMCGVKLQDSLLSLFVLGIFCGILMFVAVDGYAKTTNPIILFMGVATFILCGFEHCVADMFYFTVAQMWSLRTLLCLVVITLGNSLGGVLILLVQKVGNRK